MLHTATLHKPHVATHTRQAFVDTNITGTLNLLEEAAGGRRRRFVFTSTTSAFGRALVPPPGAPAAWITEDVAPVPKNIYGVTKVAAENLCELFHRRAGLPCLILRTSRFFPEPDDRRETREAYADANVKANEFLFRRVDVADIVDAHLLALEQAAAIGFGRYIISATTPFTPRRPGRAAGATPRPSCAACVPGFERVYAARGWSMFPSIDRVYDNARARHELGLAARLRLRPHRAGPRVGRHGRQRPRPDHRVEGLPRRGVRRRPVSGGLSRHVRAGLQTRSGQSLKP